MHVAGGIAFGLLAAAALIGGGVAWPDCTNNWRAVLRLAVKADACKSSYARGLIMMASTFTSPGGKMTMR